MKKKLLEVPLVILFILIVWGCLWSFQRNSLFAAPANTTYTLLDDFSWIHPYNNVSALNPYWQNATGPLWDTAGYTNPGDIAYHTNNLGYYESSGKASNPNDGGLAKVEPDGYRSFTWNNSESAWWWYTLLSLPGQSKDISNFYYLSFRVKGKNGGEIFKVKLETLGFFNELNVSNYLPAGISTQWQTVKIPLSDFGLPNLNQAKAVVLVFYGANAPSPKTIYFDDITLLPQNDPVTPSDGFIKPQSQGPVKIVLSGQLRKLTVNNADYFITGFGYAPIPIGSTPQDNPYTQQNCNRDFPLLTQMPGFNTIRTWSTVGDFHQVDNTLMDSANNYNTKVCAGFWIPYGISFLNDWAKGFIEQDFKSYVNAFKNHPALLIWVIGNENNYVNGYDWHWYNYANSLAETAYQQEASTYHPVAIVEADLGTIGDANLGSDDAHLNYIDVIGLNSYRGKTFGNFFDVYSVKTQKPLWLSEYGIDAYNNINQQENPLEQTYYNVNAWVDIVRHKNVCIGATLMEYSDEWWKDPQYITDASHLSMHDFGGFINNNFPDQYMNEEWWGVAAVQDNGTLPDLVFPRDAANHLYSTTIGGKVNLNAYPNATEVFLKKQGGGIYKKLLDTDGLYYFTQLTSGIYWIGVSQLFSPPRINPIRKVVIQTGQTIVIDFN